MGSRTRRVRLASRLELPRGGQDTPPGVGEAHPAGKGSEVIADPDIKGRQRPGLCSGFWRSQLGESGTHSWPRPERKRAWFGREDNVLCFGPAKFKVPGEVSGEQWSADPRARREAQVIKMWESSAERRPMKT